MIVSSQTFRFAALLMATIGLCGIAPRDEPSRTPEKVGEERPYLNLQIHKDEATRQCPAFREPLCAAECENERSCVHLCCHRHCEAECNFSDPKAKSCHKGCEAWRDGKEEFRPY